MSNRSLFSFYINWFLVRSQIYALFQYANNSASRKFIVHPMKSHGQERVTTGAKLKWCRAAVWRSGITLNFPGDKCRLFKRFC